MFTFLWLSEQGWCYISGIQANLCERQCLHIENTWNSGEPAGNLGVEKLPREHQQLVQEYLGYLS